MVKNELSSPKKRLLKLQPGYYALRYSCESPNGPIATIGYAPTSDEGSLHVIGTRRGGQVVLSPSSSMALVFVEGDAVTALLSLFFPEGAADAPVRFDVEKLSDALPSAEGAREIGGPKSLARLSGHVEMIGDVECAEGDWLGQKGGHARLEGFAIHWPDRPLTVDIRYGCTIAGLGTSPASLSGGFVGARKKMAKITSLWMELAGPDANDYKLSFSANFSKSATMKGRQGEAMSGLNELDWLTGLHVSVISKVSDARTTERYSRPTDHKREFKTFKSNRFDNVEKK